MRNGREFLAYGHLPVVRIGEWFGATHGVGEPDAAIIGTGNHVTMIKIDVFGNQRFNVG